MHAIRTDETVLEIKVGDSGADRSLWVEPIFNQQVGPGISSIWEPTLEERALIASGHNIELHDYCGDPPLVFAKAMQVTASGMGSPLPQVAVNQAMRAALEKACDDNDYCLLCDNHPSHGHADDCLLKGYGEPT